MLACSQDVAALIIHLVSVHQGGAAAVAQGSAFGELRTSHGGLLQQMLQLATHSCTPLAPSAAGQLSPDTVAAAALQPIATPMLHGEHVVDCKAAASPRSRRLPSGDVTVASPQSGEFPSCPRSVRLCVHGPLCMAVTAALRSCAALEETHFTGVIHVGMRQRTVTERLPHQKNTFVTGDMLAGRSTAAAPCRLTSSSSAPLCYGPSDEMSPVLRASRSALEGIGTPISMGAHPQLAQNAQHESLFLL